MVGLTSSLCMHLHILLLHIQTMEAATQSAEVLRKQINDTDAQLKLLKDQLAKVEAQAVETSFEELSGKYVCSSMPVLTWNILLSTYLLKPFGYVN